MIRDNFLYRLTCAAVCLAFFVVTLGAYTRLKDAGLGCPDWPGCYGQLIVPSSKLALSTAQHIFSGQVVEPLKAWAEMTHRYVAGTLGVMILVILGRSLWTRREYHSPLGLPILIVLLVIFQASLGRWTVTLKLLPPVVMLHLLGGFTLLVLLSLLALRLGHFFREVKRTDQRRFKIWALLGLVLLVLQIMLGGWTSANYASLACPSFPFCNNAMIPPLDFSHAFTIVDKIGPSYQGGLLDQVTRITIQFSHRLGALCVASYWLCFLLYLLAKAESKIILRFTTVIFCLLVVQVILGVSNILLMLPVHVAVSHNAVAAILLVVVVSLNYALFAKQDSL